MPAYHVSKTISLNVAPAVAFAKVCDFRQWKNWSPWLILDPECQVTYADDGRQYAWDGPVAGAGEIKVTTVQEPSRLECALSFYKPFKAEAQVAFQLAQQEGGTEITWTMDGSLPWFLFFLKGMMTACLGSDYERGLAMLKDDLELGSVPSALDFKGVQHYEDVSYVGLTRECAVAEIGPDMEQAFGKLQQAVEAGQFSPQGAPLSIYHKWDMVKGRTRYTAALPVAAAPKVLADGLVAGELAGGKAYVIDHTGPYRHLGNGWAAAMMHARARKFKGSCQVPPFEVYVNDPAEVPEAELVTRIHHPAK